MAPQQHVNSDVSLYKSALKRITIFSYWKSRELGKVAL